MTSKISTKQPERITVPEAAAVMGVNPQFLRLGLQQGKFPFGVAVKRKRWAYYINPVQFREYCKLAN